MKDYVLKCVMITFVTFMLPSVLCYDVMFRMEEEEKAGFVIGNIRDKYHTDSVSPKELRFTLLTQGRADTALFNVEIGGNLTTTKVIDREAMCKYTTVCQATLLVAVKTNMHSGIIGIITVLVEVEDINDNAPTFSKPSINLSISEVADVGNIIAVDGARDMDTSVNNSIHAYRLQPSTVPFNLTDSNNFDGISTLNLIVSRPLDRETENYYSFHIIAIDGGTPRREGKLLVHVSITDVNDNQPLFEQSSYNVTITDNVNVANVILTLRATDHDIGKNADLRFRLSAHQPVSNLRYFSIDEIRGELKVKEKLNISSGDYFKLTVEAVDSGVPELMTQTVVYVSVLHALNNVPNINLILRPNADYVTISEAANIGTVVAHVAIVDTDPGRNGDVNCSILSSSDVFALQFLNVHGYAVILSMTLDRETVAAYNVIIHCENNGVQSLRGTASFRVRIQDENDNAPNFSQQKYIANIDENNQIGDVITTVLAYDLDMGINSMLTYSMATAFSKYASIDPITGVIVANKVFGKESADGLGFSMTIYATDAGVPTLTGTTSVVVTINNCKDGNPAIVGK